MKNRKYWLLFPWWLIFLLFVWFMHGFIQKDGLIRISNGQTWFQHELHFRWGGVKNLVGLEQARTYLVINGELDTLARTFDSDVPWGLRDDYSDSTLRIVGDNEHADDVVFQRSPKDGSIATLCRNFTGMPAKKTAEALSGVKVTVTPETVAVNGLACTPDELPQRLNAVVKESGKRLSVIFELTDEVKYGEFVKLLRRCPISQFAKINVRRGR